MSKVKVKTLIGSVVTVAFFLTVIVAFLFYAFPENVASATGFGPYDGRLRLTVPVRLLPEPRLGKGRRIQLGRTGLLGLKAGKLSNSQESLTVSLGCYEGLQWSVLPPAEDRHYRFD